jgi:ADP-ribose pyrophosphatase YjhB (NUDIX family)/predicted transcriptional regulator
MNPKYQPQLDPIQKQILQKLITQKNARFSQLQPENIENDLFNYHLKFLIQKGLINKTEKSYSLTTDGVKVISNFNVQGDVANLFKASVALYVVKDLKTKPQMLMQRRKRVPFQGDVTSVAGKILWGERVEYAAKRKLFEETGLVANFNLIGILRKTRLDDSDKVLEDTIYHCCYADNPTGNLLGDTVYGDNFWLPFDQVMDAIANNIDGGVESMKEVENVLNGRLEMHYFHQISRVREY